MNVGTGGRVAGALLGSAPAALAAAPAVTTTTDRPATVSAGRLIPLDAADNG
ncbi:hypothetical protein ABZ754_09770 [Micromonospora purpureochromogenes]|uniref:hypothetical protein n=1 Tax=Micromonospora purpureochromogenes TaxID=47872 RepID=UPI0033DBFCC9